MRICQVLTHLLSHDMEQPFQSSFSTFNQRRHLLVEIRCENGLVGWGECLGPADINAAIVKMMTPLLIGKSALDIEPIWLELYNQFRDQGQRGVTIAAISGIDIALWDLAGKYYEAPVYQLLGGAYRMKIPAYATGGFRQIGKDRISSLVAEVNGYVEQGFKALKIKIGFGIELDIASIAAVREAIGSTITLMIDANHGYDVIDAITVGKLADAYDIEWFEEPVVPEALQNYQDLRARQPLVIAGGETWHTRWGISQALQMNAVDIIQPDVCGVGGLTEAKKIITLADVHQVRLVPHVWGTNIAMAAGLHYHAILPPSPSAHEAREAYFEFDQTFNPFRSAIVKDTIEHQNGFVYVPDGVGLGIEVLPETLSQFYPQIQS
ncbi:MAG: mandelate racemase/muconate lactonizing enzyme family protein [Oceanospirillaceae bacterium]